MPPTLNELLTGIAELAPDAKEFATALQSTYQPGFQEIFERGHKTKSSEAKKSEAALTATIKEKETEIAGLNEKLETAGKGTVEVEKIRADHKKDLADLKAKHATELTQRDERLKKSIVDGAVKDAQADYEAAGIFPIHAKALAEELRDRIRPNLEANSFDVLKEAGSDVALQPSDGKPRSAIKTLVEETRKPLVKEMYVSGVAGKGAGSKIDEGAGGSGSGNVYDSIRARRTTEKEEGKAGQGKAGALLERMGVAKPA